MIPSISDTAKIFSVMFIICGKVYSLILSIINNNSLTFEYSIFNKLEKAS